MNFYLIIAIIPKEIFSDFLVKISVKFVNFLFLFNWTYYIYVWDVQTFFM